MAKYRTAFVCGHYVDIPVKESGWDLVEAVIRFPHLPLDPKYAQVKVDDDTKVCAAVLHLATLTFETRTPWDGRLIGQDGKWISEAARELVRLLTKD